MPIIQGCPNIVPYESSKRIIYQMENNICLIKSENGNGTGFFCKIPYQNMNNMIPALITNNHIINGDILNKKNSKIIIEIKEGEIIKVLCLNDRIKYTNREYNITIIEIKQEDNINNYLELDNNIIKGIFSDNEENEIFIGETVYGLQYPQGKLAVSYGILHKIYGDKKYLFLHKCSTKDGSSGAPILDIKTNKVIGIHHSSTQGINCGRGTLLNYPLKEFISLNTINDNDSLLKEFNNKYNFNIKDTKITKLDLRWKSLGNNGLEDLCKIEFKELKELILNNNNISDIKIIGKAKFEKIEILDLSQNKISDIDVLEKVIFKDLKQLYLGYNNISDIKVFDLVQFDKLEALLLNDNKIDKNKNAAIISKLKTKIGNFNV